MALSVLLSVPLDTLESISNPAIQIGTPEELRSVVEGVPLLGFLDILGLASRLFTIYSIIVAESYLRIGNYCARLKARLSFTNSSWGITILFPLHWLEGWSRPEAALTAHHLQYDCGIPSKTPLWSFQR